MIAAAYLRKSNDEGAKATDMKSVQLQRDEIEAFARERGWTLDERYVYTDDGNQRRDLG
jgi:DNA invertase Pin-like site-specific DNA recombinase